MLAKFGNVTTFWRKFSGKKFLTQKSYDMSQNFALQTSGLQISLADFANFA